ncbi:MAG: hypothetical protein IKL36_01615 [Clostridia bacterium]|nr:hypothetical protein [Clostridia bacterium]
MVRIRCCLVDPNKRYRGIDREVDMRVFNRVKDSKEYDVAFEHYSYYLSMEEENTPPNLDKMFSFVEFINKTSYYSEVVMYDTSPVDYDNCYYIGIDIIDSHLKSIIKNGYDKYGYHYSKTQYGLYSKYDDAKNIVDALKEKNNKYSDLYCIYVYRCERGL